MIFVNFKNYPQAKGANAIKLALICEQAADKTGVPIIPCVSSLDLAKVVEATDIPVWVQHLDPVDNEKTTGFITAKAVKEQGAWGTLLNHSEHPLDFENLKKSLIMAASAGLRILVLVKDLNSACQVDQLSPDYIGLEEPSLIGGTVAMAQVESEKIKIKEFCRAIKAVPVVGAGINNAGDVKTSLALGAKGILISSGVVLADKPLQILEELAVSFTY